MKLLLALIFYVICHDLQAQKFVSFNKGYIPSDSIVHMHIKSETITTFFWADTLSLTEKITNIYDPAGNLINQTNICNLPCQSTVQTRAFDNKNRMIEDNIYFYPDIPVFKNKHIYNDDTVPHKMEITEYMFIDGILDNFSRNISLYNDAGQELDYKNYNSNGLMIKHEKHLFNADGYRSATIFFSNNDKDSVIIYVEEENGLPFNYLVTDFNALVESDTVTKINPDGSKVIYIYETKKLPINLNLEPELVEIKIYYKNGLIKEDRRINKNIIKYSYEIN